MSIEPFEGAKKYEQSYEHDLDEELPALPAVPVDDVPQAVAARLPIIPPNLATWPGIVSTARRAVSVTAYRAGFHVLRLPWYVVLAQFWGIIGAFRLAGRQLSWWWVLEQHTLRQEAASKNDPETYLKLHHDAKATRSFRGFALLAEVVVLLSAAAAAHVLLAWWAEILLAGAFLMTLAPVGRPADKPIVSTAVVRPRQRRLTADIVLRAYYRAKLGDPEKMGMQVTFGSKMSRDRTDSGSQVVVDLPYGVTFSDALRAKEKLASGLDVSESQVYLTKDQTSNRRHLLYVADVDPLGIPAGRSPLLDCRQRDIWRPMPFGLDERGQVVKLPLVFTSVLVGAQPRKGKTFTARAIALYAALDPYCRLSVFDGKGSPDWRWFALVAHTYGFGLLPDRFHEPVPVLLATLRSAWQEVQQRNLRMRDLPPEKVPEGKLTREIARSAAYGMPVWVIVLDEFQEFLNTGDTDVDEEIADLLVKLVKVGPSTGIILVSSTQKPAGLGSTGKTAKRFTDYRDNHQTRFSLKTGSYTVSENVLGAGAYGEGFDSSALPVGDGTNGFDYRGIGILYNAPIDNATVRTYLADGKDAERILNAARLHRQKVGTLDGMAAGETVAAQPRDVLADVEDAFQAGETFVSWETLSVRLAEQQPDRYASVTKEALSSTVIGLGLGLESKSGAEKGRDGRPRGLYRNQLDRAISMRRESVQ